MISGIKTAQSPAFNGSMVKMLSSGAKTLKTDIAIDQATLVEFAKDVLSKKPKLSDAGLVSKRFSIAVPQENSDKLIISRLKGSPGNPERQIKYLLNVARSELDKLTEEGSRLFDSVKEIIGQNGELTPLQKVDLKNLVKTITQDWG